MRARDTSQYKEGDSSDMGNPHHDRCELTAVFDGSELHIEADYGLAAPFDPARPDELDCTGIEFTTEPDGVWVAVTFDGRRWSSCRIATKIGAGSGEHSSTTDAPVTLSTTIVDNRGTQIHRVATLPNWYGCLLRDLLIPIPGVGGGVGNTRARFSINWTFASDNEP